MFAVYLTYHYVQLSQEEQTEKSELENATLNQKSKADETKANDLDITQSLVNPVDKPQEVTPAISIPALPLEERLKLLLESEDTRESIDVAKSFLNNLGAVNFDDPNMIIKVREYAVFLHKHATGEELAIVNALLEKMDALPPLRQGALQMEAIIYQKTTQRAALEAKAKEFKEQLQVRRTHIAACDKKLAELESFKAEIEKKIQACRASRDRQSENLTKEIPLAEKVKQSLEETKSEIKQATLNSEGKILDYQKAILDITFLGRRL